MNACLNLLDFLSATMKTGRKGMSLDWTQRDLREGLRCFHSGAFFEAHEHWESVWLAAQEPEKTLLMCLRPEDTMSLACRVPPANPLARPFTQQITYDNK